ncbi:uncharacterized protein HMPREF1541_05916 [Cyphellophora europaea CBS 101466]|uniref:SMP-30/Gluconolactonase/LRE-like region domain-containing protein n=1 Tax=Cyphellophora europaea (strain CBS 101466) TaxID=1220924 RepID=W2RTN7_CYPE1|nr:uncharacterized protein HMPREF1541_05916 [Cyphellophora europaea CBS 101466]ETN39690.1 hypothetical protein HMPREF1541_05916 [Cyphellophora europaea CBS 101466]
MLRPLLWAAFVPLAIASDVTIYQPGVSYLPEKLPAPGPASHFEEIITQFNRLGRTTVWNLVKKVKIEGDTGEPEGMVNLGEERYLVSRGNWTEATKSYGSGVIINGTNRSPGAGYAHLNIYDGEGQLVADARLTEPGDIEYHLGGIDWDGEVVWATLSQYRPNTTATVVTIDPKTLNMTVVARYRDHLGGIVHDQAKKQIATLNWGARNASLMGSDHQPISVVRNPSLYTDYQDCKFLGDSEVYDFRSVMMCSGTTTLANNCTIGGLAIVDIETMVPLSEVPLTMETELGAYIAQNPFDVDIVNGKMRLYFMPDQHNSTVYIYEADENSPFQFGGGEL